MPQDGLEDDDDYLTMTFDDPGASTTKETLTQRKRRLIREAEERARPKSKAQVAEEERSKREAALNNSNVDQSSKGFKMMAALGYTPGTVLGKEAPSNGTLPDKRLLEPIGLDIKEDRSGIGADSEKKRKFREEVERQQVAEKRQKIDATAFRERQQQEREEKRRESQLYGAMKVAERLEEEDLQTVESQIATRKRPLKSYNVLWRGLAKERQLKEQEKRIRYDMEQSLSRLPNYDDPDEDEVDKIALSRKAQLEEVDAELYEDDDELEEFDKLPSSVKLDRVVNYLREKWHYCFWCKYSYQDAVMDGCPGTSEEDHD